MNKQEHIEYWLRTANEDFEVLQVLLLNKKYLHALFIAHLILEKLIKAIWVKDNENNIPPKVHNLIYLLKQTNFQLNDEQIKFLTQFNDFQLQGRYPDYQSKIIKLLNKNYVDEIIKQFEEIRICLLKQIA